MLVFTPAHKLRLDDTWIDGRAECCGPRYSHFERAAIVAPQFPPLKHTPNFLWPKREKIVGIQVWWATWAGYWPMPSCPAAGVGCLKVISGGVTDNRLGHHHAWTQVSSNIQQNSIQYPKMSVSSTIESEGNYMGPRRSLQQYRPKRWELLL
jgi:hypothetical protein